jgi:hypothetical protein
MVYFQTKNPFLDGLGIENVGIFCGHFTIWYILWSFGIFCGHLVNFSPFWYVAARKIWQPWYGVKSG